VGHEPYGVLFLIHFSDLLSPRRRRNDGIDVTEEEDQAYATPFFYSFFNNMKENKSKGRAHFNVDVTKKEWKWNGRTAEKLCAGSSYLKVSAHFFSCLR
jgi:hypothetical protein